MCGVVFFLLSVRDRQIDYERAFYLAMYANHLRGALSMIKYIITVDTHNTSVDINLCSLGFHHIIKLILTF